MIDLKQCSLGIELGSTRIKAVLVGDTCKPVAQGDFTWENRLENGIWTYPLEEVWQGVQAAYAALAADVLAKCGQPLTTVGCIGVSAMMHGYLAFDAAGKLLVPFRTWRNTMTGAAAEELTSAFGFNIPQRWSAAHLYQAMLNREPHLPQLDFFTTLAGYVHWQLTGRKVLGEGDASGMFPIDSTTGGYDTAMLAKFNALADKQGCPVDLVKLLPAVLPAGKDAGMLTVEGAKRLDPTGTLQPGMPVVEASSGSFGAALAVSCATTGHPCILVVPSNLPIAQRKRLQDLGAHIIACSSSGRRAMERVAEDTAKRYGGYYTHYFSNDDNPEYHRRVTGPQIYKNAGDAIDAIVIGVGSGGTITGVAEYIKAWNSMVRIVAVEPAECAAISGGFIGQHGISGIGPGFVPENYNPYVVDTVLTVTTADAERAAREVLFFDGVPACTSAGATLAAAVQLLSMGKAKRPLCVFAGRHIYG